MLPGALDFPGEEPRERILRAVVALAAASDGEDCTYPKIAAAAGVSHDTFYKHFSSRQEAQLAACEVVHERLIGAARRAAAAATDWDAGVRDGLGAYLVEAARDPQATRVMVLDSLSLGEPGRRFLERRARALKQLLRPALAAAPGLPEAGAEMLVGAILEVLHEGALQRHVERLPALHAQLVEIVLAPLHAARHAPAPVGRRPACARVATCPIGCSPKPAAPNYGPRSRVRSPSVRRADSLAPAGAGPSGRCPFPQVSRQH